MKKTILIHATVITVNDTNEVIHDGAVAFEGDKITYVGPTPEDLSDAGYDVNYLVEQIRQILKLTDEIRVALVGAGNLGHAISNYNAYLKDNMRIAAIFDSNPNKVGNELAGLTIQPLDELAETIAAKQIKLAIITVPAPAAQSVCDLLTQAGIKGILNFAPTTIRAPKDVRIHYADVTSNLQSLAYYLT